MSSKKNTKKQPSKHEDDASDGAWAGKEIVVCVCGGIACYKVCDLVSQLVQNGAGVTVAMTRSARKFVGPLSFQALTGRRVLTSLWHRSAPDDGDHIGITERADLIVVAPATASTMGKYANGIADDFVSTVLLCADSPILFVPAMNDRMWANPMVQDNVERIKKAGGEFIGPDAGWLACRNMGPGRMCDPEDIISAAAKVLAKNQ